MDSSSLMNTVRQTLKEDWEECLFLGAIACLGVLAYIEVKVLLPQSRHVPLVVLVLLAVFLLLSVGNLFFGDQIRRILSTDDRSTDGLLSEPEQTKEVTQQMFDLNMRAATKHLGWIILYVIGMVYIGFWTAAVLFLMSYIMIYEQSPIPTRVKYVLSWSVLTVVVLWVLFVELVGVQAIWRLGILP